MIENRGRRINQLYYQKYHWDHQVLTDAMLGQQPRPQHSSDSERHLNELLRITIWLDRGEGQYSSEDEWPIAGRYRYTYK